MSTNPFAIKQIIDERNDALDMVRKVETLNAELEEKMTALRNLAQVAEQVLRDMQAQDLPMEWQSVLEEALDAATAKPA